MNYYEILDVIHKLNIELVEKNLPGLLKGMYCDNTICIDIKLTQRGKKCILSEELGHHFTSYGDVLDKHDVISRKQEVVARRWGHLFLVPLDKIQEVKSDCDNIYQLAEQLDVTEEFLIEAIDHYQQKHGIAI